MKKVYLILSVATFTLLTACSESDVKEKETAIVAENVESKEYQIDVNSSIIEWVGSKIIGESHSGTIQIKEGSFIMKDDKIESGKISIDMSSILVTDITDTTDNAKLYGHLTTGDFFNIAEHPTATLKITDGSDMNNVKANLTIKGITEPITFALSTTNKNEKLNLTSKLQFDRTKYGITYGSGNFFEGLGDKIINDNIDLNISIITK